MPAQTQRGRQLEARYYSALAARIQQQNQRTGTVMLTSGQRISFGDAYTSSALNPRRIPSSEERRANYQASLASSALASGSTKQSTSTEMSLANIVGAVGNVVGAIFSPAPPASGPTPSPTSTLGTVVNAAAGAAGALLPGMYGAGAVATLPGRATGGGMSEFMLERPTGSGGAAMSGLARLGIPSGWTRKKVRALVRYVGPGQAAQIIGAPLESVAIVAVSGRSRGRGITARDLRTTKRVTRRVLSIARDLAALRPSAPRRSGSRTVVRCN